MYSTITCADITGITWLNVDDHAFKMDGTVHVWRICISLNILAVNDLAELLSADEHARAARYHQQKDRERFIISRGALRILLAKYLNVTPAGIVFETGVNKKPFVRNIEGAELHYNTSHSGDYILIAIAGQPVGVDIENIEPVFPYQDILQHSFSPDEIAYIDQSNTPLETFYALWTRKEALLKATAKGIDDEIKLAPCLDGEHIVQSLVIGSSNNWFVHSFNIGTSYTGSMATLTKDIKFSNFLLLV